ncbi:aldo/keto reductase [Amycolatopsis sp.]|uniref:aldo/keto reductase n=1 Tax=Amycolatopsis sp. TaxID=37632 RepID=UPI002E184877
MSFGTAPLGDMFGAADETEATAAVHRALDAGITFFDSSPYYGNGLAERRLGAALREHREDVVIGTKAGRYGSDEFDFTPKRLRESVHRSLELLQTDYVDILQLHDIEFVDLGGVFADTYAELVRLRDEGKCRYIGMTGYPMGTLRRAVTETDLDVVLSYAHYTLLNTRLADDLAPLCGQRGVGLINAAAVALGLLTPAGSRITVPAGQRIVDAARRAAEVCARRGADIAFLANQFSIQRSGAATTVVGTTKARHLDAAVAAESAPIDEDLLAAVLAVTADVRDLSWSSGLPDNNGGDTCSA